MDFSKLVGFSKPVFTDYWQW